MKKNIRVISPAGKPDLSQLKKNVKLLQHNFNVTLGKYPSSSTPYFAATDEQRLEDLQNALDDDSLDLIWMSRGGYGLTRIIDSINWKKFKKAPKGIIGFSDITALHIALNNQGYSSLHAPMMMQLDKVGLQSSVTPLLSLLEGNQVTYTLPTCSENKTGKVHAPIVGGNLTLIASTVGTATQLITKGKILFLEEVGEPAYKVDRMMVQLERAGLLKGIKGLIIGSFTDITHEKEFGMTAIQSVLEKVKGAKYPIVTNFPAGHSEPNLPIVFGRKSTLEVTKKYVKLIV
ncbi:MAG: LD-carboxypeptidase [Cytophagaceae bacterium]